MVKREEVLQDLFHILAGTHWPNDKPNTTLTKQGANRVPKPPRSGAPLPSPPLTSAVKTEESRRESDGNASTTSCFDWDALISSLDPNYNIEVRDKV